MDGFWGGLDSWRWDLLALSGAAWVASMFMRGHEVTGGTVAPGWKCWLFSFVLLGRVAWLPGWLQQGAFREMAMELCVAATALGNVVVVTLPLWMGQEGFTAPPWVGWSILGTAVCAVTFTLHIWFIRELYTLREGHWVWLLSLLGMGAALAGA